MADERVCSIPGCGKRHGAKGWCYKHYDIWRNHGDPLFPIKTRGHNVKFIEYAIQFDGEQCLLWPFSLSGDGYGTSWVEGKVIRVHRYICQRSHGKPPSAKHEAAHGCGQRACCNPKHLRWATRSENQMDRAIHDTHRRGTRSHLNKLTENDVREIRQLRGHLSQREIAEMFGVSSGSISMIWSGRSWAWLT